MNKRVLYASFVPLDRSSAQGLQVDEMCRALALVADLSRIGIAKTKEERFKYRTIDSSWHERVLVRKIGLVYRVFRLLFIEAWDIVLTRNKLFAILGLVTGNCVVLELHNKETGILRKLSLWIISRQRNIRIVTISMGLKEEISRYTWVKASIIVLHDAVRKEDIREPKYTYKIEHTKTPLILYTGSFHKGNDIDQIELFLKCRINFQLHVIGGRIEEVQRLMDKYPDSRLIVSPRIAKKDIFRLRDEADLLFYPLSFSNHLYRYTSPLKLFEYMSSGIPIIASAIGSVTEIIDDSSAFCYDPSIDQNIFEKLLMNALFDANMREEKARLALKDIANYTWLNRAESILNLF